MSELPQGLTPVCVARLAHGEGNGDGFLPWSGVAELSDGSWRAIYDASARFAVDLRPPTREPRYRRDVLWAEPELH